MIRRDPDDYSPDDRSPAQQEADVNAAGRRGDYLQAVERGEIEGDEADRKAIRDLYARGVWHD
jgi:hypothetical protein